MTAIVVSLAFTFEAIVLAGSSGLGRAVTKQLVSEGATVVVTSSNRDNLEAAVVTSVLLVTTFVFVGLGSGHTGSVLTVSLAIVFGLLGLAVYGCTPVKNALISEYATRESSGSLFGVTQTASAAGSASGPAIFGYLATEVSITVAFPAIAVVGGIIAAGFYALSRRGQDGESKRSDRIRTESEAGS